MLRNYSDQWHVRASSYETGDFARKACICNAPFIATIICNKLVRKKYILHFYFYIHAHTHTHFNLLDRFADFYIVFKVQIKLNE